MFLVMLPALHWKFVLTSDWADNVPVILSSLLLHGMQQDISQNNCFQVPAASGMTYLQLCDTCRFAAVFPWRISQEKCQGTRTGDIAHLSLTRWQDWQQLWVGASSGTAQRSPAFCQNQSLHPILSASRRKQYPLPCMMLAEMCF